MSYSSGRQTNSSGLSPNRHAQSASERREDKKRLQSTLSDERVAEMRKVCAKHTNAQSLTPPRCHTAL